jgi:hypothetical protein
MGIALLFTFYFYIYIYILLYLTSGDEKNIGKVTAGRSGNVLEC